MLTLLLACAWTRTELYFGTERPGGANVSEAEWDAFVAAEVAPRFPAGFTVGEVSGHWRGPDGRDVVEGTHVVTVFVHGTRDQADAIAQAYARQFGQDAVLVARNAARARFVSADGG